MYTRCDEDYIRGWVGLIAGVFGEIRLESGGGRKQQDVGWGGGSRAEWVIQMKEEKIIHHC